MRPVDSLSEIVLTHKIKSFTLIHRSKGLPSFLISVVILLRNFCDLWLQRIMGASDREHEPSVSYRSLVWPSSHGKTGSVTQKTLWPMAKSIFSGLSCEYVSLWHRESCSLRPQATIVAPGVNMGPLWHIESCSLWPQATMAAPGVNMGPLWHIQSCSLRPQATMVALAWIWVPCNT